MLLWVEGVDCRVRLLELCTLPDAERELLLAAGCELLLELLEFLVRALELLLEERELLLAAGCDLLLELLELLLRALELLLDLLELWLELFFLVSFLLCDALLFDRDCSPAKRSGVVPRRISRAPAVASIFENLLMVHLLFCTACASRLLSCRRPYCFPLLRAPPDAFPKNRASCSTPLSYQEACQSLCLFQSRQGIDNHRFSKTNNFSHNGRTEGN